MHKTSNRYRSTTNAHSYTAFIVSLSMLSSWRPSVFIKYVLNVMKVEGVKLSQENAPSTLQLFKIFGQLLQRPTCREPQREEIREGEMWVQAGEAYLLFLLLLFWKYSVFLCLQILNGFREVSWSLSLSYLLGHPSWFYPLQPIWIQHLCSNSTLHFPASPLSH